MDRRRAARPRGSVRTMPALVLLRTHASTHAHTHTHTCTYAHKFTHTHAHTGVGRHAVVPVPDGQDPRGGDTGEL